MRLGRLTHEKEKDMADEEFVPGDEDEQNVPEGDTLDADPDLPDEDDPEFQAEIEAGHDEGEIDDA